MNKKGKFELKLWHIIVVIIVLFLLPNKELFSQVCIQSCQEGWHKENGQCIFTECGSACDGTTYYKTEQECLNPEEQPECTINEDCKELAKTVCDDGSLWYDGYYCYKGKCTIAMGIPPEDCISTKPTIGIGGCN